MLISTLQLLASAFKMQRLFIICDFDNMSLGLRKNLFTGKQTINVGQSLHQLDDIVLAESNLIICASTVGVESLAVVNNRSMRHSWIIVHSEDQEFLLAPTRIDQQIYFYNEDNHVLKEKYSVNSIVVERKLDIKQPQDKVIGRRSDLQGTALNLAVAHWPPLFGVGRKDGVQTLPSQDEYYALHPEDTYGWLNDLMVIMARELNFTFNFFSRVDEAWGTYDPTTSESSGMIRSLVLQDVDMAWSSLRMTVHRHAAVDFLFPYYKNTYALIIRRQEGENYSWILFLNPMNRYLWMMLGLHSLFLVVIVWSFWWYYNRKRSSTSGQKEKMPSIQEQAQHYLAVCSSYLGGSSGAMPHDDKSALKVILFASSIVGTVIWMSYRASLASTLAVREFRLPFESLAELADNRDYRFMMGAGGSSGTLFYQFKTADKDSPERRLFEEHIAPDVEGTTFGSEIEALNAVLLSTDRAAVMLNFETLHTISNVCDFAVTWKSGHPDYLAAAVPKNSPYKMILNRKLLQLIEAGTLDLILRRWEKGGMLNCKATGVDTSLVEPLGHEKLISMFIILVFGYALAVVMLSSEIFFLKFHSKNDLEGD